MVNKYYEVIVFTASTKWYADSILDYIDPTRTLIQHRVYRDNCVQRQNNVFIKDLRVFKNRELKDLVIVDNAVFSFGAQLANGIPIAPFKNDKDDREFLHLMNYLAAMKDYDDLRILNREAFKMEQVYQFRLDKSIQYYDYDLCDEKSDDDYSDTEVCEDTTTRTREFTDILRQDENNDPLSNFGASTNEKSNSMGSKKGKLPKSINDCLDQFTMKMAKTRSFHQKLTNHKLAQ